MLMPMQSAFKHATAGLEFKFTKFDTSKLDEKTGEFSGYASRFGNEDLGGDVVAKGAFATSLKGGDVRRIKMLYEHEPQQPIGYWLDLAEDDQGLMARGKLLVDELPKAREVHALMKAGVLDGMSIGYRVRSASHDRTKGVRVLEDIDLKEISAVLFPMNEEAVIETVKSSNDVSPLAIREFERWLMQDAGLTRSMARQIIGGWKSVLLQTKQDAGREVAMSMPPAVDWSPLADELRRLTEAHSR